MANARTNVEQRPICHLAAWLAGWMMCVPSGAAEAGETVHRNTRQDGWRQAATIRDIALQPGGLLVGQVLDESMRPLVGVPVEIRAQGVKAAATISDSEGLFAVAGLRGGVHQVVTAESVESCRLWAPGTAPPRAEAQVRFVKGASTVVRGQWGPSKAAWKRWATNPWVVGGVLATAIAVPIAVNNSDDDDSGS